MSIALFSLWLPIVLSAVAVFVVSSLIWTVVKYHNSDWQKLPDEDAARGALKGTPPGQYTVPHAADDAARKSPEWQAKYKEGPAVMMMVMPHGSLGMGKQLGQWFAYCLVMSLLIAYVTGINLGEGADAKKVFQVSSMVGLLTYGGYAASGAIWFGHTWSRVVKDIVDGAIYGLVTAAIFTWLWP